jgi:DNA-binding HxlR family transcriptional regulator
MSLDRLGAARCCKWCAAARRLGARHINGISTKVLNDRLRAFTRVGIFERMQFPEIPPRVEYHLTDFGKKFLTLLKAVEKLQRELIAEAER